MTQMFLDRVERDHQLVGDLSVPPSRGHRPENLQLTWRQGFDQGYGCARGSRRPRPRRRKPERPDHSVGVVALRPRDPGGTITRAGPSEAPEEGGHWRALIGEDTNL